MRQGGIPLANRVDPFGALFSTPSRGRLMGNRGGRFHAPGDRTVAGRPFAAKQWICCVLAFEDRRRIVWATGYTELFFMDEVTALAAGHRPCFECRRADAMAFAAAWGRSQGGLPPSAPAMDQILHGERLAPGRAFAKRLHRLPPGTLPAGAMLAWRDQAWAIAETGLADWTPEGFRQPQPDLLQALLRESEASVLTPPSILACLREGYRPAWRWL